MENPIISSDQISGWKLIGIEGICKGSASLAALWLNFRE